MDFRAMLGPAVELAVFPLVHNFFHLAFAVLAPHVLGDFRLRMLNMAMLVGVMMPHFISPIILFQRHLVRNTLSAFGENHPSHTNEYDLDHPHFQPACYTGNEHIQNLSH